MLWLSEWQSPRPGDRRMQTLQRGVGVYLYVPMGPLPSLSSLLPSLLLSPLQLRPLFFGCTNFDALSHQRRSRLLECSRMFQNVLRRISNVLEPSTPRGSPFFPPFSLPSLCVRRRKSKGADGAHARSRARGSLFSLSLWGKSPDRTTESASPHRFGFPVRNRPIPCAGPMCTRGAIPSEVRSGPIAKRDAEAPRSLEARALKEAVGADADRACAVAGGSFVGAQL